MNDKPSGDTKKGRAVHTDPDVKPTPEQEPLPKGVTKKPVETKSPAEWAYERLILYIQNFEKQLDGEHEVAIGVTNGGTGIMRIEGIGYFDPDIVTFYGTDPTGGRKQLIQHVSQLSVGLTALPKPGTLTEPRRIGFRLAQDLEED
ncbi:MAG: DUF6173 family protein [Pseudomonadota bacterium]